MICPKTTRPCVRELICNANGLCRYRIPDGSPLLWCPGCGANDSTHCKGISTDCRTRNGNSLPCDLKPPIPTAAWPRLPVDSAARKHVPMYSGLLRYFPDACAEVARLSQAANDKHNPGEPMHWSREKSSDHGDCIVRHQTDAGTMDDDGFLHDVKVAWRALAQLQLALERLRGR
jgi:hypothetical protein